MVSFKFLWWGLDIRLGREPERTAKEAYSRLRYILAVDRIEGKTRNPLPGDIMRLFLGRAMPVLLMEKFPEVRAMPASRGQVIKWRKIVPFSMETFHEES